jgi:hypothetical protein
MKGLALSINRDGKRREVHLRVLSKVKRVWERLEEGLGRFFVQTEFPWAVKIQIALIQQGE